MITNKPNIGKYILSSGVDRIFIDLEVLGKKDRQKNLNTWKSSHQKEDISEMRKNIKKKNILVRLNPWNNNSPFEIDYAIRNGADYLMLPMIKSFKEISTFCQIVNFRVPVIPLIETKESLDILDKVIEIKGIKELFIGLNDLSISSGYKFMFEPLINGTLDQAAYFLNKKKIRWGFGGIAKINDGVLPAKFLLGEHVRLNSTMVILSRTFHQNLNSIEALENELYFKNELKKLKDCYSYWLKADPKIIQNNHQKVKEIIESVIKEKE